MESSLTERKVDTVTNTCDTCGTSLRWRTKILDEFGARCVPCSDAAYAAIAADPMGRDWLADSVERELDEQIAAEEAESADQAWLDSQ
jgi:hypothetical protein